jgi:hypothetical protein
MLGMLNTELETDNLLAGLTCYWGRQSDLRHQELEQVRGGIKGNGYISTILNQAPSADLDSISSCAILV